MGVVTNADGFDFHDGLSSNCIVIKENRVDEYVEYINSKQITELHVCSLYYTQREVGFFARCPHIEEVTITSSITDFSGLYHLANLKILTFDELNGEIDLSKFTSLEEAYVCWSKNLKKLSLRQYKPKGKNLEELSSLKNIEMLIVTQGNIVSLEGCKNFEKLNQLEINYRRNLELIDGLEYNVGTLKSLRFDACKKIKNHEYVTCLKELELLAFDNCGDIPSLGFLRQLPKLNFLSLGKTNVVDGDLSPCIGLGHVGFQNKKHYSHKFKELNPNFKWHV